MKIYSAIKTENSKEIKILGINIYSKISNIDYVKRKYLYGLFKKINNNQEIKYYILGIKVYSQKDYDAIVKKVVEKERREIKSMLSVFNLHSKVFPKFKNHNYGKKIIIAGCGPTINYYNVNNDFIHIGLNKAYKIENIKWDYLFFVDRAHKGNSLDEIINIDCIKFLGFHCNPEFSYNNENILYNPNNTTFCYIPEEYVIRNKAYRFYSNAHRNEIYYDIETSPLMDFGSVAFCAIHFALYTHPKRIYLVGCDCANNGYFNNEIQPLWNDKMLNRTFYGYNKLKKFVSVYYPETEIISVNPVGLKGLFRDVYTKPYIEAHPEILEEEGAVQYFEDECFEEELCD